MADFYGVNFTKFDQNVPKEQVNVAEHSGRMRVQYDSYEADAGGAATTTLSVGDSTTADRFVSALKMNAANKVSAMFPKVVDTHNSVDLAGGMSGSGIDSFGHEYTSETDIIITVGTAAFTGTIKCCVWYTVD